MTKLEMCYDGALVMPSNYAVMNEEEMTYVDGGSVLSLSGSASYLKRQSGLLMTAFISASVGNGSGAAASTIAGLIPLTFIIGVSSGYCGFIGNEYRKAYNYFSKKVYQNSKYTYKLITYTFANLITGVDYMVA